MRCQKCGKKLKEDETFCSICGYYNSDTNLEKTTENWKINEITSLEDDVINSDDEDLYDDINDDYDEYDDSDYDNEIKVENHETSKKEKYKKQKEERKTKKEVEKDTDEISDDFEDFEKESLIDIVNETDAEEKGDKNFKFKANSSGTKEKEFYYENEEYLESYIGEDYKKIKKSPFNIFAFILNWMYVLYRKMYATGIVGLIISGIIIIEFRKYMLIFIGICMLLIGFGFNKYYIFISKKKLERLLEKYNGEDKFTIQNIVSKKGGVNVIKALIIYLLFLACVILTLFPVSYNKNHNEKYWNENTENKATCTSLAKTAYTTIETTTNGENIIEATCKVTEKGQNKEYEIYLKNKVDGKDTYSYYITEDSYLVYKGSTKDIPELERREEANMIAEEDKEILKIIKKAEADYKSIYNESLAEDKLIEEKKNTEEKTNYIITKEEITR